MPKFGNSAKADPSARLTRAAGPAFLAASILCEGAMIHQAFRSVAAAALFALSALIGAPVLAEPSKAELAAAAAAETRGAAIYAYDQAAWHASDAFQSDLAKQQMSLEKLHKEGLRGYVVEPDGDLLLVTFFKEGKEGKRALARYWVRGSKVERGGILAEGENNALSPLALRLIDARGLAIAEAVNEKVGLCSSSSPNFVILPPGSDGVVSVYILTSTTQAGIYPAGGHFRYDFDASSKLVAKRRFMKSCFPLDTREQDGKRPVGLMLTHLLDPQPTEIHVFVSYNIPVGLYVATTSNGEVWEVNRGRIRPVKK
jgi:hypothetical protein